MPMVLVINCVITNYPETSQLETTNTYHLTQCMGVRTSGAAGLSGSCSGPPLEDAEKMLTEVHHMKA